MRLSEPSCLQPGIRIRGHDQRVLRFKIRELFLVVNNRVGFFFQIIIMKLWVVWRNHRNSFYDLL